MGPAELAQLRSETWQRIVDASHDLMDCRRFAIGRLQGGRDVRGARVVADGPDLTAWTMARSHEWTHLLSTRPATTLDALRRSLPNNRELLRNGLTMTSVFDHDGTAAAARAMLTAEDDDAYLFSSVPLQMRIIDHAQVLLHGPAQTILALEGRTALDAALRYWDEVMRVAIPCRELRAESEGLSPRQSAVLNLLCRGDTDEQVARTLGLSVRTIRAEVSKAMGHLDAHSRFAIGYRFALHDGAAD